MADKPVVRELFIDELAQVSGGGPVEDLLNKVTPGGIPLETTMACCEESTSGCCA